MLPKKYLSGSAKRKLKEKKEEELKKLRGNLNKFVFTITEPSSTETPLAIENSESK